MLDIRAIGRGKKKQPGNKYDIVSTLMQLSVSSVRHTYSITIRIKGYFKIVNIGKESKKVIRKLKYLL